MSIRSTDTNVAALREELDSLLSRINSGVAAKFEGRASSVEPRGATANGKPRVTGGPSAPKPTTKPADPSPSAWRKLMIYCVKTIRRIANLFIR